MRTHFLVGHLAILAAIPLACEPAAITPSEPGEPLVFPATCRLDGEELAALRARSERSFAKATYCKPHETTLLDPYWAPLVYLEQLDGDRTVPPFGAVSSGDADEVLVDPSRPTIYMAKHGITVGGWPATQYAFVMIFPETSRREPKVQAVRYTYDDRGLFVCGEVYRDRSGVRLFYVAHRVEEAARAEFGGPLEGRSHAVEPSATEHPDVTVVRIVKDPAAPLGPYVYVCAEEREVTTLHCRCVASQIGDVTRQLDYELVPFERLNDLHGAWLDALRTWIDESASVAGRPSWLEIYLRLPKTL
ncbi:MAG: hypothetical protein H6834_08550 [Planctomycetes bacterium]|nr:hypothetical protein [Planctomycetota bacterium]